MSIHKHFLKPSLQRQVSDIAKENTEIVVENKSTDAPVEALVIQTPEKGIVEVLPVTKPEIQVQKVIEKAIEDVVKSIQKNEKIIEKEVKVKDKIKKERKTKIKKLEKK
jgi:hypothetical protein